MTEKIRISCVSYLNAAPFRYGLENHSIRGEITLSHDSPSDCARKLINGSADIGLVPVAAIINIPGGEIISGFCIAADGPVKSVTLLSQVPLGGIGEVLLDYESMTSVKLVKVLAGEFWNIHPEWKNATPGFENKIRGATAAVVIGDRSLDLRDNFEFVYDLSEEWKKFTGLPFVFACWISTRSLGESFLRDFEEALSLGVDNIPAVVNDEQAINYLTKNISYHLDEEKIKGMKLFLSKLAI